MFGLTFEKLFVVALLAAVIIGPRRLPDYAARLAALLRKVAVVAVEGRRRAEEETGVAVIREDWRALDPRQYDPRRIIREAWAEADAAAVAEPVEASVGALRQAQGPDSGQGPDAEPVEAAPTGRWVVSGTSAHPRRVWVPAEV